MVNNKGINNREGIDGIKWKGNGHRFCRLLRLVDSTSKGLGLMEEHEKFKNRFGDLGSFKEALERSYDEYAEECLLDFEEFKRVVKFKRKYNPRRHDKEVRRVRLYMKRKLNEDEPKIKKIRKPRHDKEASHYMAQENHPFRGRKEYGVHPYPIDVGIPFPEKVIHLGLGDGIKEKLVWPFHFMGIGDSMLVPNVSRNALMKAATNWSYSYKRNLVEEDVETGDYREVKRKFLVSEIYENDLFIGSRIWLIKKEYI